MPRPRSWTPPGDKPPHGERCRRVARIAYHACRSLIDPTIARISRHGRACRHRHAAPSGQTLATNELLGQIGEGGMGAVYRARPSTPVRRNVALKVINLGHGTRRVISRFEPNGQALAMMDHPNIARTFDSPAPRRPAGPYFVMNSSAVLPSPTTATITHLIVRHDWAFSSRSATPSHALKRHHPS